MGAAEKVVSSGVSRVRYFFGQLLTERDLESEQHFHLLMRRLVQREAFGTGTVAGLEVTAKHDGRAHPRSVYVLPGFALDPDGRELLLLKPVSVEVAPDPGATRRYPFDPAPTGREQLAAAVAARFERPFTPADLNALVEALAPYGLLAERDRKARPDPDDVDALRRHLETINPTSRPSADVELVPWTLDRLVGLRRGIPNAQSPDELR